MGWELPSGRMFPTNPDLIRSNPVAFPTLGSGLSYGQQISLTISSIQLRTGDTLDVTSNIIWADFNNIISIYW